MNYEYRVSWRRENDSTHRTRIYQTQAGAEDFAQFLRTQSWDEIDDLEDYAIEHLRKLGNPTEVIVQSRQVGLWV